MKLNSVIISIGFACFIYNANAQTKKPLKPQNKTTVTTPIIKNKVELYKINEFSFFNPSHMNILEKEISDAIAKNIGDIQSGKYSSYSDYEKTEQYVGRMYDNSSMQIGFSKKFLDHEFRHIGNDWFYVEKYFGRNRILHKEAESFNGNFLNDNFTERALNDSIFILGDGSLFNVYKNEYLTTALTTNKILKIINLPEKSSNGINYGDGIINNDEYDYKRYFNKIPNYNLLSEKRVIDNGKYQKPKLGEVAFNNRFSNYVLSGRDIYDKLNLINRYNVEDAISLNSVTKLDFIKFRNNQDGKDFIPVINNDSLFIIGLKLDLKFIETNTDFGKINVLNLMRFIGNTTSENKNYSIEDFTEYYGANIENKWKSTNESVQKKITNIFNNGFKENYFKTVYFHGNFNKLNEEDLYNTTDLDQKIKIVDKYIEYIPEIIFVYNNQSKKIQLLKRNGLPFQKLSKLLIDRTNNLLIAQSFESRYTIFDLRNGKEIITAKGIVNHISDENKLMLNLSCSETNNDYYENSINYNRVSGYSLDLNELLEYNKVYSDGFIESLNIDEFSSDEDFKNKISVLDQKNRVAFMNQAKTKNSSAYLFAKPYQPDNNTIHSIIENQIKKFILDQGPTPSDIKLLLKYTLWDPNTKILRLTSKLDSSNLNYFKNNPYWSWTHKSNEEIVLLGPYRSFEKFECHINEENINFEIGSVEAYYAKKIKDGSINLTFIMRNDGIYIPGYNHIVYNRNKDLLDFLNDKSTNYVERLNEFKERYLLNRNSLNFYNLFFMKENEDEIPVKNNKGYEINDGFTMRNFF